MARSADPRRKTGPFRDLFEEIRRCKEVPTCTDLPIRSYYFEPNPYTLGVWRARGLFRNAMGHRVAFVCESLGPSGQQSDEPLACWTASWQDQRFQQVREQYGLDNCYITNTVKCGPRNGPEHTYAELDACLPFLVRELDLIRPRVVVGVGGNATKTLRNWGVLQKLQMRPRPQLFEITHYSYRGDPWPRWKKEFSDLLELLGSRDLTLGS